MGTNYIGKFTSDSGKAAITTTPDAVVPDNLNRKLLNIDNVGAATVLLADSSANCTDADAPYELEVGESVKFDADAMPAYAIYAATLAGTSDLRISEA